MALQGAHSGGHTREGHVECQGCRERVCQGRSHNTVGGPSAVAKIPVPLLKVHLCSVEIPFRGYFAFPEMDVSAPGYSVIIKPPMDCATQRDEILPEHKSVTAFKALSFQDRESSEPSAEDSDTDERLASDNENAMPASSRPKTTTITTTTSTIQVLHEVLASENPSPCFSQSTVRIAWSLESTSLLPSISHIPSENEQGPQRPSMA
ncbi:uncharacterized protein LOC133749815 isoform X2 [Lepus europaeus]|uniref:uncharacterized protein LOC133749815 isoform X2 n=1 Tax=Lepus europaeus TaxID=9983 RepID=UPI002B47B65A|nr:uncharacterized protein LOC133749815 isoform X2 [Lepus europaeus]